MSAAVGLFGGQPGLFDGEPLELRAERIDKAPAKRAPLRGFLVCENPDSTRDGWRPAEGVLARTMDDAVAVALQERGWRSAEWTRPPGGGIVGRKGRAQFAVFDPRLTTADTLEAYGTDREGRYPERLARLAELKDENAADRRKGGRRG